MSYYGQVHGAFTCCGRRSILEKALFWDFDGTLVLPDSKWSKSLHEAITYLNYDVSIEEIRSHMLTGYTWHTPELAYPDDTGPKWWDKLFRHFDALYEKHAVTKADAQSINQSLRNQILNCKSYTLYADTIPVLRSCMEMGYKNYILSNNFPELSAVIKDLGLSEYFLEYIVSASVGYEKPRTELFQYALEIAHHPEICYMIGDNPIADIQGGRSAGMKTILVHRDGAFDADDTCDSLSEIPPLLTLWTATRQAKFRAKEHLHRKE